MKSNFITGVLVLMVIVMSAMFIHQGKALDGAVEDLAIASRAQPVNMVLSVANITTDQRVGLACSMGADVEGVSDYAVTVHATGKHEVTYGCSHVKTDILTPPAPPAQ